MALPGLKTTWGRIPLEGVWPLSPSFDTVGPIARDVSGLVSGMELLEPGFAVAELGEVRIGRDPRRGGPPDQLRDRRGVGWGLTGWACTELPMPGWEEAGLQAGMLLVVEAWHTDRALVAQDPEGIGRDVRERLELGASSTTRPSAPPRRSSAS